MHYEAGRVMPGESLEESNMPDEWMAVHYGWGYITDEEYKRAQTEIEEEDSMSEVTNHGPQVKEKKAQWSRWKILWFAKRSQRLQHGDQLFRQQSHQRRVDQESGGKGRVPLPKESKDPHFEDECDKAA